MKIHLKKFNTSLSSREAGKSDYKDILPLLNTLKSDENIEIDFEGLSSFSPSWGDEFLTPLLNKYGNRLVLLSTKNLSVNATIELLEDIHSLKFKRKNNFLLNLKL